VLARYVHNDRLVDALHSQAFSALSSSPGARRYYDALRARGIGHSAALRQLANRLVGILHGCLKTGTLYNETKAWAHQHQQRSRSCCLTSKCHGMSHPPVRHLVTRSGLPPVRLHDLRHGAATLAHAAGADLKTCRHSSGTPASCSPPTPTPACSSTCTSPPPRPPPRWS
jgi:hypothetical protein